MMKLTRLREYRQQFPLTQRELAERAALSQRTIHMLESGAHEARPATTRRLAAALGVKPAELTDGPRR